MVPYKTRNVEFPSTASAGIRDIRRIEHTVVNKPNKNTPLSAIFRRRFICSVQRTGMGGRKITTSKTIVTTARALNVRTFARHAPGVTGSQDFWAFRGISEHKGHGQMRTDRLALENQHESASNMAQDTSNKNEPDNIAVNALAVAENSEVS
jgi:hypothetical protein